MTCNMDCFNCPYDDCINDDIKEHEGTTDEQAGVIKSKYQKRRAAALSRAKEYRAENLEKVKAQERECYARHKEEYRAKKVAANRKRYWDNPEEARRKKREYYHRKKAEREAQLCQA